MLIWVMYQLATKDITYMWQNAAFENKQYNEGETVTRDRAQRMSLLAKVQIGWDAVAGILIVPWVASIVRRK